MTLLPAPPSTSSAAPWPQLPGLLRWLDLARPQALGGVFAMICLRLWIVAVPLVLAWRWLGVRNDGLLMIIAGCWAVGYRLVGAGRVARFEPIAPVLRWRLATRPRQWLLAWVLVWASAALMAGASWLGLHRLDPALGWLPPQPSDPLLLALAGLLAGLPWLLGRLGSPPWRKVAARAPWLFYAVAASVAIGPLLRVHLPRF